MTSTTGNNQVSVSSQATLSSTGTTATYTSAKGGPGIIYDPIVVNQSITKFVGALAFNATTTNIYGNINNNGLVTTGPNTVVNFTDGAVTPAPLEGCGSLNINSLMAINIGNFVFNDRTTYNTLTLTDNSVYLPAGITIARAGDTGGGGGVGSISLRNANIIGNVDLTGDSTQAAYITFADDSAQDNLVIPQALTETYTNMKLQINFGAAGGATFYNSQIAVGYFVFNGNDNVSETVTGAVPANFSLLLLDATSSPYRSGTIGGTAGIAGAFWAWGTGADAGDLTLSK